MYLSKTPLRTSLSGGSTDFSTFYSKYGSFIISFGLNKYTYVAVKSLPSIAQHNFELFSTQPERTQTIEEIQNPGVRGVLTFFSRIHHRPVEKLAIYINNDLVHQSGLGSSAALVVGLLNSLYCFYGYNIDKYQLAIDAIHITQKTIGEQSGIQDEIASVFGGLNSITIARDGIFKVRPIPVCEDFVKKFCNSCALFFLGGGRKSYEIVASHNQPTEDIEKKKLELLTLSYEMKDAFYKENLYDIAILLHKSWLIKKSTSSLISNTEIDDLYDHLLNLGILGGKLCGTGGSGFIFGIFPEEKRQYIMDNCGVPTIPVGVSKTGSEIIFQDS